MGFIETSSLAVLINDSPSHFIFPSRGLRQGCPLFLFIFLFVADGLSILIFQTIERKLMKGINVSKDVSLTHLLFLDDVILFGAGLVHEVKGWDEVLEEFYKAIGMQMGVSKLVIITNSLEEEATC